MEDNRPLPSIWESAGVRDYVVMSGSDEALSHISPSLSLSFSESFRIPAFRISYLVVCDFASRTAGEHLI